MNCKRCCLKTLVPGHFMGQPTLSLDDLRFTRNYLNDLETALPQAQGSQALIETVKPSTHSCSTPAAWN